MNPKQIVLGQQLTLQRSRKMRRNCAAYNGVTTTASSTSVQLTTTLCALPGWEFVAKHCSSSPHLSTNKLQSISLPHLFEFCFFFLFQTQNDPAFLMHQQHKWSQPSTWEHSALLHLQKNSELGESKTRHTIPDREEGHPSQSKMVKDFIQNLQQHAYSRRPRLWSSFNCNLRENRACGSSNYRCNKIMKAYPEQTRPCDS